MTEKKGRWGAFGIAEARTPLRNSGACEPATERTERVGSWAIDGFAEANARNGLSKDIVVHVTESSPSLTAMASSCKGLLAALKDCVLNSDCVIKDGRLPSECLKDHIDELPEQCQSLRKATFECKRGMVRSSIQFTRLVLMFISWTCANDSEGTLLVLGLNMTA